jgi:hypothetical protein
VEIAQQAQGWLATVNVGGNLDTIRSTVIDYILQLN